MASVAPSGDNGFVGYSQSYDNGAMKFNPTTAVVIVVLMAAGFMVAFVWVVVRRCVRENGAMSQTGVDLQSGSYNLKARGLEKAHVDALPLVRRADLGQNDDHECPVCLMDFGSEENLRLLPSCKHVFHQDCIDMWFDSHSTCPLCRASLLGSDAGPNLTSGEDYVGPGAPVNSIYEASENGDSDAEVHGGRRRDAFLEESRSGRGAAGQPSTMITREDEHSSANGALFRNSESFKRVARGVEAYESATADAALEKNSKALAGSDSIPRSTALGADLVSLRNLLMGADQNASSASGSTRWFARARSLELEARDRTAQSERTLSGRDEWVTVDLETGKATPELAKPSTSLSRGESSKGPAPERSWSDRFSLSGLKSLKGIAILSRSSSDVSWRHGPHLPI